MTTGSHQPAQSDASDAPEACAIAGIGEAHRDRLAGLGVLLASIAHEINNVLTPGLCYSQLAQRSPGDAELARKAIDAAATSIDRAHQIASLILRLASPAAPRETPPRVMVDESVQNALNFFQCRLDRMPVDVRLSIPFGIAAAVDPLCLEQVLVNLLANAIRAVGSSGQVTIEAECSAGNSKAVIRLADTGAGMPPALLRSGFQPFAKPEPSSDGHGLGLSICKRLIEAAGGRFSAESSPGQGTAITLELPLAA